MKMKALSPDLLCVLRAFVVILLLCSSAGAQPRQSAIFLNELDAPPPIPGGTAAIYATPGTLNTLSGWMITGPTATAYLVLPDQGTTPETTSAASTLWSDSQVLRTDRSILTPLTVRAGDLWPDNASSKIGISGGRFDQAWINDLAATRLLAADGSATTPTISFESDGTLGFYNAGASTVGLAGNLAGTGTLGISGQRWSNIYAAAGNFTGDIAFADNKGITGEGVKVSPNGMGDLLLDASLAGGDHIIMTAINGVVVSGTSLAAGGWTLNSNTLQSTQHAILNAGNGWKTIIGDSTGNMVLFDKGGASVTPATTGIYDLGTTTYKWRDLFLSRNATISGGLKPWSLAHTFYRTGTPTGNAYAYFASGLICTSTRGWVAPAAGSVVGATFISDMTASGGSYGTWYVYKNGASLATIYASGGGGTGGSPVTTKAYNVWNRGTYAFAANDVIQVYYVDNGTSDFADTVCEVFFFID